MHVLQKQLTEIKNADARIENGYLAVVYPESCPRNPREDKDNCLFHLLQGSMRRNLWSDEGASLEDLADAMKQNWDRMKYGEFPWREVTHASLQTIADCAEKTGTAVFPVFREEHGSVAYSARPFGDRWDSACAGLAWVSWQELEEAWGRNNVPDQDKLLDILGDELKEFQHWTNGEVFVCDVYAPGSFHRQEDGSVLLDENAEPECSCGGLLGPEAVDSFIEDTCSAQNGPRP